MDSQEPNKVNATEKLEEVQNELHCSICHDYFVQASTLFCSHSFCFTCINAWRQTHTDCPVCRREVLGMAPSRALDNMVAALVDRTNSEAAVQAGLQQFGVWLNPAVATPQTNDHNLQQDTQQLHDSDYDNENDEEDWDDDEEEEDSYSGGSYDAEEEEYEGEEEEEDQEEGEEEEEYDGTYSNSDDDDDDDDNEEYSEDDDDEHANRSNQNNPNNDEYWRMRGWSGRPDNWKELMQRQ